MKKLFFFSLFFLGIISVSQAQVSAGINLQSTKTFITVGTNTDNQIFGEGRLGVGRDLDVELMGGYNVIQKEEVNFYLGLALGLTDDREDDFYLGIPFGLLVKPFNSKNFGVVIEAAPIFPDESDSYLRGGFGFKYTFR